MRACPLIVTIFVVLFLSPGKAATNQQRTVQGQGTKQAASYKNAHPEPHRVNAQYPSDAGIDTESSKYEKGYKTDPAEKGWIEKVSAFATVAVAVFALVTAVLVGFQIKTARDIERSWLLVHMTGQPNPNWPYMTRDGYIPGILIRFKVFGKTPIHIREVRLKVCFVPSLPNTYPAQPDLPRVPDYRGIRPDNVCVSQNGTIPPEALLDIRRDVGKSLLDNEGARRVVKGQQLMCAYGRLKYADNFGRQKETRVCYVYDFESEVPDIIGGEEVFAPAGFRKAGTEAYNKAT